MCEWQLHSLACLPLFAMLDMHEQAPFGTNKGREKPHYRIEHILLARYRNKTHHPTRTSGHQFRFAGTHIIQINLRSSLRTGCHISLLSYLKSIGCIDRLNLKNIFLLHIVISIQLLFISSKKYISPKPSAWP